MAMNKKIKREWLKALRSGKYKQGRIRLCAIGPDGSESFCCLGVLYDACIPGALWVEDGRGWAIDTKERLDKERGVRVSPSYDLTPKIRDLVGLLGADCDELAYRNDSGSTFAQIADYIEKNL